MDMIPPYTSTTITHLPPEIVLDIFLHSLNPNLLFVCKKFYISLAHDPFVQSRFLTTLTRGNIKKAFKEGVQWRFFDMDVIKYLDAWYNKKQKRKARIKSLKNKRNDQEQEQQLTPRPTKILFDQLILPSWVLKRGDLEMVSELISRGGDVNEPDGRPIVKATKHGHEKLVALLLLHGANPIVQKHLAFLWAIRGGQGPILSALAEYYHQKTLEESSGCEGNRDDVVMAKEGLQFALKLAVKMGDYDLMYYLMGKGAIPCLEALGMLGEADEDRESTSISSMIPGSASAKRRREAEAMAESQKKGKKKKKC